MEPKVQNQDTTLSNMGESYWGVGSKHNRGGLLVSTNRRFFHFLVEGFQNENGTFGSQFVQNHEVFSFYVCSTF